MFVQVIQGPVADRESLARQFDRWSSELRPGATGWLGATAGVTDDDRFVAVVRFASAEAAQANGERPEQGAWWAETEKCFSAAPEFHDCEDVEEWRGGRDDAGFVQVMQGGPVDRGAFRDLDARFEERADQWRPDLLGSLRAWHGDGRYTEVAWFTSEDEAREGERKEPPPEAADLLAEFGSLTEGVTYFDLRQPWLLHS